MIYAVDRYIDVLKVKETRESVPNYGGTRTEKYHYFDTEAQADAFIRSRAQENLIKAEKALKRAQARVKKCEKKFSAVVGKGEA